MSRPPKIALFTALLLLIFSLANAQQDPQPLPLPGTVRTIRSVTSGPQDRDVIGMPYHGEIPTEERRARLIVEFEAGFQLSAFTSQIQSRFSDVKVVSEMSPGWVVIKARPEQLSELRQLPGVKAVYPDVPVTADNASTVPYIGAQNYWNTTSATGSGVIIAVIDSGIDYRHKTFGGAASFPSVKVVGGYDYVDSDNDPMDCDLAGADDVNAHGTHIAATAAGFGVVGGSPYSGPWNASTNFGTMSVGPGVAPQATLLAYRVLDCSGTGHTSDVISAINQAVTDGADVINLALSTAYGGSAGAYESAINAAANEGVIVVASAGDGDDTYYITGQPGTSRRAISVGSGNETANVSTFSARGPGTGSVLKPDLVAPGENITSAFGMQVDTAAGTTFSGTSMASAHVAGASALLREKYPSWTYSQIKALLMNNATSLQNSGNVRYGPGRVGAGGVNLNNILNAELIAYNASNPELVSISFGVVEVTGAQTATSQLTVQNLTASAQTYTLGFDTVVNMPGVEITVNPSTLTVPANGTASVNVVLTANVSQMIEANIHDGTLSTNAEPRHWISEESGYITLTRANVLRARIPVYAMPRPSASMSQTKPVMIGSSVSGVGYLDFAGTELLTGGNYPYDVASQVTLFEHRLSSPQLGSNQSSDFQYLGITSDYLIKTSVHISTMYFGISTYGKWTTPSAVRFVVELDINNDGTVDGELFNSNLGAANGSTPNDTFVSVYHNKNTKTSIVAGRLNEYAPTSLDTRLFNTNVMVLPVDLSALGFVGADRDFQYRVKSYMGDVLIDQMPASGFAAYNVAAPIYSFNDLTGDSAGPYPKIPMWIALNEAPIPVDYNLMSLGGTAVIPDILALHHHNAVTRAEVIDVQYVGPTDLRLTKSISNAEPAEGAQIVYTVQLHNNGAAVAPDVKVSEVLPVGLTLLNATATVGNYTGGVWNLSGYTLQPGAVATLTLTAKVNTGTLHDRIINQVAVLSTHPLTTDTNPSNDSANVQLCVGGFNGCEVLPLGIFTQTSPAANANFTSGTQVKTLVWTASQNAIAYGLTLNRVNPAGQLLNVTNLTPAANTDPLTCQNGTCIFTVSPALQAQLTPGSYQWAVTATNGYDILKASNAPLTFKVNPVVPPPTPTSTPVAVTQLLQNGGFEQLDGNLPTGWKAKGMVKDKAKCNKPEKGKFFSYTGNCTFMFKGEPGENSKLVQTIDLAIRPIGQGDTLTLSVYAQPKKMAAGKLTIMVKFAYPDGSKDKFSLTPDGDSYSYKPFSILRPLTRTVSAMKVMAKFKGTSGKVFVDDLSLTVKKN